MQPPNLQRFARCSMASCCPGAAACHRGRRLVRASRRAVRPGRRFCVRELEASDAASAAWCASFVQRVPAVSGAGGCSFSGGVAGFPAAGWSDDGGVAARCRVERAGLGWLRSFAGARGIPAVSARVATMAAWPRRLIPRISSSDCAPAATWAPVACAAPISPPREA